MRQRLLIAHHEAGHAVVANLLEKPYGAVIYRNSKYAAGVAGMNLQPPSKADYTHEAVAPLYEGKTLKQLDDDALITAAGYLAQGVAAGDGTKAPSGGDWEMLNAAAKSAFGANEQMRDNWLMDVMTRCLRLLMLNWAGVERVAVALDKYGQLLPAAVRVYMELD